MNKKPCASFIIDENEIVETAGMRFDNPRLAEIFRRIENDERIWSAIEEAKADAIRETEDSRTYLQIVSHGVPSLSPSSRKIPHEFK